MAILREDECLFRYMDGRASVDKPKKFTTTTSRKARVSVDVEKQCGIMLRYIVGCGDAGAADFEGIRDLAEVIPTIANSWRPRRKKLFDAGFIQKASITRKSPSGCDCDVWIATSKGKLDGK